MVVLHSTNKTQGPSNLQRLQNNVTKKISRRIICLTFLNGAFHPLNIVESAKAKGSFAARLDAINQDAFTIGCCIAVGKGQTEVLIWRSIGARSCVIRLNRNRSWTGSWRRHWRRRKICNNSSNRPTAASSSRWCFPVLFFLCALQVRVVSDIVADTRLMRKIVVIITSQERRVVSAASFSTTVGFARARSQGRRACYPIIVPRHARLFFFEGSSYRNEDKEKAARLEHVCFWLV